MSVKTLSFFILIFVSLTLLSCSSDPSAIGSSYLKGDQIKLDSLDSFKDTLTQVSSTYQHSVPLGYANSLLLGVKGDNTANTLLSFNIVLPDSIIADLKLSNLTVTNAFVQLFKSYVYGDSTSALDYSVHEINKGWTSTSFTIDSFKVWQPGNQYNAADIGSSKSVNDSLYQFSIPNSLASTWITNIANGATPDNGILLIPSSGANKIVGFYALSPTTTVDIPYIYIVVNKPNFYIDTLKFSTTADLSVVSGPIPQNQQDYMFAQSSVILESRLKFNLSKLPPHAIINYAELDLTIDSTKSVFGVPFTDQLIAKFITDTTNTDSISNTSTSAVVLNRSGSIYTGNITYYIQTWLSLKNNMGIEILPSTFTEGVDLWAIYGSNATDPAKRPRLKITYTNKL